MSRARDFGAAADGATDDTAALQQAIDDGDGLLELAKGCLRITAPLVLDTTRHGYLSVSGWQGTSRIVMDGPGPAIRVIGNHQGTAGGTIGRTSERQPLGSLFTTPQGSGGTMIACLIPFLRSIF